MHLTHGLFLTWTQRFYYIVDYILQYLHDNRCLIQPNPLLPTNPCLLTWRTNFFARGVEYPSTLVPGLPTTAPTFASPPTLSHPTVQVTLFTQTTSATPVVLIWNTHYCQIPRKGGKDVCGIVGILFQLAVSPFNSTDRVIEEVGEKMAGVNTSHHLKTKRTGKHLMGVT